MIDFLIVEYALTLLLLIHNNYSRVIRRNLARTRIQRFFTLFEVPKTSDSTVLLQKNRDLVAYSSRNSIPAPRIFGANGGPVALLIILLLQELHPLRLALHTEPPSVSEENANQYIDEIELFFRSLFMTI